MEQIVHALMIIATFGIIFTTAMISESYFLKKKFGEPYDLRETIANITSAVLYKTLDAIYILTFFGTLTYFVQKHGLQLSFKYNWLTFLFIFVAQDFCFYLWHLTSHKIRLAWIPHRIHHSSTHYNLGVALRQSALAPLSVFSVIIWAPFAFLGLDMKVVAFIYELNLFYQFWIHTRLVSRLPNWYEFVFNTPSHHRVHHSKTVTQMDYCNYGGVLIIWDRLFKTFVDERVAGNIIYGVKTRPIKTNNVFVMITEELFDLIKTVWRTKDLRHIWKSPDWK